MPQGQAAGAFRPGNSKFTRVLEALLILACASALALVLVKGWDHALSTFDRLWVRSWAQPLLVLAQILMVANLAAMVWRIYLMCTYRPTPGCQDEDLPTVTVVVPAYNEGRQVAETLRSVLASDYPPEKLQIIAVDDGSRDDTWQWMQRAHAEVPDRITLIQQPRNMGKRRALYDGFQRGSGEVFVTIDSDSLVLADTIRNLVSPMARDAKVGGVAGNVRVLNRKQGLIPRMMEVSFTFSFDFIRASQSRVNTVMCTPGALSAYRREAVTPVLDGWLMQTFLGKPANIGEDRAMTNLILQNGYHVLFQRNAVVYTEVPTRYRNLCKMFLRWARSNVRESLAMTRFIFRDFRDTPKSGARINLILEVINLTLMQLLKLVGLLWLTTLPIGVSLNLLLGALMGGGILALFYAIRHRSLASVWGLPYGVYNLLSLSWISTYALCTPHNSGWLTRQQTSGPARTRPPAWSWRLAVTRAGAMASALVVGSSLAWALSNPMAQPLAKEIAKPAGPVTATVRHQGKPVWTVRATAVDIPLGLGPITLNGVDMMLYSEGRVVSRVRADQAVLNLEDSKSFTFKGRVRMNPTRRAKQSALSSLSS